jgi:phosphatidylglycerol:prolipoprotein diacylglycerol transferase
MPFFAIPFPMIDPVAVEIGPLAIRWYALAYVVGILLGWRYMTILAKRPPRIVTPEMIDDLILWITLGIIFGGRLGYVLFYKPGYFIDHPLEVFALWQGGMSFHGGLIGVLSAIWLYARLRRIDWRALGDITVCAVPIGLFLGRLANFVNGELFGRPSDVPWAIAFPRGGPMPRHPSQLYEACLEGAVLLVILWYAAYRTGAMKRPGLLGGIFLTGYGTARVVGELFREPDAHLGFLIGGVTMGQFLSLPLILAGIWLIAAAPKRP